MSLTPGKPGDLSEKNLHPKEAPSAKNEKYESIFSEHVQKTEGYLKSFFINYQSSQSGLKELYESLKYSFTGGAKRFRPVLALLTAQALGQRSEKLLPYALAVEFIHTYSLIHDDLPCMDDDDVRRGRPTNHKVFGEATALLAGDALQAEAFYLISTSYIESPESALKAIIELSRAAGPRGMVGGQAIDMYGKKESLSRELLEQMHTMKTGALIRAAVVGSALICKAQPQQLQDLQSYAEMLGLAFQVADDLLDYDESAPELGSFTSVLGVDATKIYLEELSHKTLMALSSWDQRADPLRQMVQYNLSRNV